MESGAIFVKKDTISPFDVADKLVCQIFTNNEGNFPLELEWENTEQFLPTGIVVEVFGQPVIDRVAPQFIHKALNQSATLYLGHTGPG